MYPLDIISKTRDTSRGRNSPGVPVGIRYYPGPYGRPKKSTYFYGGKTSVILFPNNGNLKARDSITLIAWIYPESGGQIFEYKGGVRLIVSRGDTLYFQVDRRQPAVRVKKLRRRQWNYVAATYNHRTQMAILWYDSIPVVHRRIVRRRLQTHRSVSMGRYFKGRIMCMQVYNVALNRKHIQKLKHLCTRPGELWLDFNQLMNVFESHHMLHIVLVLCFATLYIRIVNFPSNRRVYFLL